MDDKLPPQSSTESLPFCSLFIAATWPAATEEKFLFPFARAHACFLDYIFFPAVIFSPGARAGVEKGFFFFEFCGEVFWRSSTRGHGQILAMGERGKLGFLLYCGTSVALGTSYIIFTNAEIFNPKKKLLEENIFLGRKMKNILEYSRII
jgi:hypothetical protein